MGVFNLFSVLFLGAAFIAQSNGGINRFLPLWCVKLHVTPSVQTFDSAKDAMQTCVESDSCVGLKNTSDNGYQHLIQLTGYVIDETCRDYFLWDKTRGVTFPKQPNPYETVILFAIFPYAGSECPPGFDVDGSLCRGQSVITEDMCATYPSYMAARYDGTSCFVHQKQTIINLWS
uniref:Uncharacterized protein n=1 Tax=Panagrolaimus sp. PS1159 TaxID=55785 RepID=A0AC35GDV1_9BILA